MGNFLLTRQAFVFILQDHGFSLKRQIGSHQQMKSNPHKRLLGAHMSIAGGVEQAILRGHSIGCQTIQLFTKNNNQWQGKPLTDDEIARFKKERQEKRINPILSHDAYLINLASPNPDTCEKSLNAFTDEIVRVEQLGIDFLVMHPGAHLGKGEDWALKRIAEAIGVALEKCRGVLQYVPTNVRILLEITAGQGTNVGYKFEHLAEILEQVNRPDRMGVCLDTCHLFAAGYDIRTQKGYQDVMKQFDDIVGLERIKAVHLNDSKKGLACRVDRHEHIGKGAIGLEGFRCLLNDPRFEEIPMVLETPKGADMKEDVVNLQMLRGLIY